MNNTILPSVIYQYPSQINFISLDYFLFLNLNLDGLEAKDQMVQIERMNQCSDWTRHSSYLV